MQPIKVDPISHQSWWKGGSYLIKANSETTVHCLKFNFVSLCDWQAMKFSLLSIHFQKNFPEWACPLAQVCFACWVHVLCMKSTFSSKRTYISWKNSRCNPDMGKFTQLHIIIYFHILVHRNFNWSIPIKNSALSVKLEIHSRDIAN